MHRVLRRAFNTSAPARSLPKSVRIVEVGPRDGLQNEKTLVSTATKAELIRRLAASGLTCIEATSFVSKQWVPQMGDATELMAELKSSVKPDFPAVRFSALTPNQKGWEAALAAGVDEVAIFAAASESFSKRNINCGVIDSFSRFAPIIEAARAAGIPVRGYVSCVLGCPYEGPVHPEAVAFVTASLLEMGAYEVSLGDTIGVGVPTGVRALLRNLIGDHGIAPERLAVHFHSTYGAAPANIVTALEEGVATVDAAVGGLGGCPYAAGASGNVPTEDVVYLLEGMGVATGVDFDALAETGDWITTQVLGRPNESRAGAARVAQRKALERKAETDAAAAAKAPAGAPQQQQPQQRVSGGKPVPLCWPAPWPPGSPLPLSLQHQTSKLALPHAAPASAKAQANTSVACGGPVPGSPGHGPGGAPSAVPTPMPAPASGPLSAPSPAAAPSAPFTQQHQSALQLQEAVHALATLNALALRDIPSNWIHEMR